jgi:hypothetical protein
MFDSTKGQRGPTGGNSGPGPVSIPQELGGGSDLFNGLISPKSK